MSDFIPTTEEVRAEYSSEFSDSKSANRAFDLWLAQYEANIIAKTEERIIKLLEGTDLLKTIESGAFVNYADTAVELIKGEQK